MKIGIIRIDKMGDMILTLPIIESIKKDNPNSIIHIYASNKNYKILKYFKYIDKIFNIDNEYYKKEKYDYIFNFSPGWKSFFLSVGIKSINKANLIFTSRYRNKLNSKALLKIFSKIFFHKTHIVNRIKRAEKNISIHQTEMMFELLDKFNISYKKNLLIEKFLPKIRSIYSTKKICLIHLSSKWINKYYNEKDFIHLIKKIENKFNIAMTTDETTRKKFINIFDNFLVINNKNFENINSLNKVTILENLNFANWTQIIYSSSLIITPECGCTHIAAACKIPTKIIYDADNQPDMIYKEYAPWQNKHEKFIFNEKKLNILLTKSL